MENRETEKTPKTPKSFLTVGPTLHYSHKNVQRCWLLAAVAFAVSCLVWSRIVSGVFWAFDLQSSTPPDLWRLGQVTVRGASIFEYPWQIIFLGLLMGIMAVVPVLIAQLMSFNHSVIFVLAIFFLANLPGFAVFMLMSCFAVACRPLRFRSRIIAIALCMAPQLIYWGVFGGARGVEPLEWGFSFAPWIWAWIVSLTIAGLVLGIGHFTRYRPGLIWIFTTTTLLSAVGVFEWRIGFDELDFQLHVAENNPEEAPEFQEHNLRTLLDETVEVAVNPETSDTVKQQELNVLFVPTERIPLRQRMKEEIQIALSRGDWPTWLDVPETMRFAQARKRLTDQYDIFMRPPRPWWMPQIVQEEIRQRRLRSARMPIALYYKGIANEYRPDLRRLQQSDVLTFYWDHVDDRAVGVWNRLYRVPDYNDSPESIEARWRVARQMAGQEGLDTPRLLGAIEVAERILTEAGQMIEGELARQENVRPATESLFGAFRPPPRTAMTAVKLNALRRRIRELETLIGPPNRQGAEGAVQRLARFVALDPHDPAYETRLATLLERTPEGDGLRDNLLLAQAKLTPDEQRRGDQLAEVNRDFPQTDGGQQALYELTRLKIQLYQAQPNKANRDAAVDMLILFKDSYPGHFYIEQVQKNLDALQTSTP